MRTGQTKKLLVKWKELKLCTVEKNIAHNRDSVHSICYYIYYVYYSYIHNMFTCNT